MKNILSENMLRFATKNLSESAKKDLIVKSIMETIDQHGLHREVRTKLTEQAEPTSFGPVSVTKFFVNGSFVQIKGTDPSAPIQTVKVAVKLEKPKLYSVSFQFADAKGTPINMMAYVRLSTVGDKGVLGDTTWDWATSFKNYSTGDLTGLVALSPQGQGDVAKLFQQMANLGASNRGNQATAFMTKDLAKIGFPFKNQYS
jgi:hypothetical protein